MSRFRIAICGAGIESLCLAHTLCNEKIFEVFIFEKDSSLRNEGAAVSLGRNAQAALQMMSPELGEIIERARGVQVEPSMRLMMGTGSDAGRHVGDICPSVSHVVVQRARLIGELCKLIPCDVMRLDKHVKSVKQQETCVRLLFEDGSCHEADAVIGCDGINSVTRRSILGNDHPAAHPVYTGGYHHRAVINMETAVSLFGEEYCRIPTQYGWIGDGGFLLTDHMDSGAAMRVIACWSSTESWPYKDSFVEWDKDTLEQNLGRWGPIGSVMARIFMAQPTLYATAGRVHPEAPRYCRGYVCMAGDAAQAILPFQGAGAGIAIEDAMILSTVLKMCNYKHDIARAFTIYDTLRRPRREDAAKSSRWAALLCTGRAPDSGLNAAAIARNLPYWGVNIHEYDLAGEREEAIELMDEYLNSYKAASMY